MLDSSHIPLAASLLVIAAVFGVELGRARGFRFGRLTTHMLFVFRIFLGIVFTILGVVGSLLPVMQGWIFFLLAVVVLFPQSKFAVKVVDKAEGRLPRLAARLRSLGIGVRPDQEPVEKPQ